jgi:hypothetical protein
MCWPLHKFLQEKTENLTIVLYSASFAAQRRADVAQVFEHACAVRLVAARAPIVRRKGAPLGVKSRPLSVTDFQIDDTIKVTRGHAGAISGLTDVLYVPSRVGVANNIANVHGELCPEWILRKEHRQTIKWSNEIARQPFHVIPPHEFM